MNRKKTLHQKGRDLSVGGRTKSGGPEQASECHGNAVEIGVFGVVQRVDALGMQKARDQKRRTAYLCAGGEGRANGSAGIAALYR